ncbi:DNA polymerase alpha catalytic subunit isoform X1 [Leptopilina heterotoma]|uniref:DNA polymerase alpha catalytic subunit isoform X1 n=1 Tax=Leptopilina heterotoma TaxID=63436 RepID=UPI001CA7FBA0|nr:DNA polymerase alpha catalytic subunit isoform X1 [Leptopilina heterotoma]
MDDSQPSSGRVKRQKLDKAGRFSALEKLRQLKGAKNKYEVDNLENVYDQVEEKEYNRKVLDRQADDWIVDDGGGGYVEDGREIFDDDMDEDSIQAAKQTSTMGPRKKAKIAAKNKGNIKNLFMNMASKAKVAEKINDDNILGDLMSELKSEDNTPNRSVKRKNKFAVTKPEASSASKVSKTNLEDTLAKIEADENMLIIDAPSKNSSKLNVKKERSSILEQNSSQVIEDFDDSYTNEIHDSGKPSSQIIEDPDTNDTPSSKDVGSSQIIEDPDSEDVKPILSLENIPDMKDFEDSEFSICKTKTEEIAKSVQVASEMDKMDSSEMILDWEDDFKFQADEIKETSDDKNITLPLSTNEAGESTFRFYWWDAYEDPYRMPGTVNLFGKFYLESSKTYVSCCVVVKNIPRRIYILPREQLKPVLKDEESRETTMEDVYDEFNNYAGRNGIKEFRSMKVTKNYSFEREGTPKTAEYMEVRYSASYPQLDASYSGRAIEAVFGTSVNALEYLLIERNIKGPCWLDIKCPTVVDNPFTWCKFQVNCLKPENITVVNRDLQKAIPPMVVATLNVRSALNPKHHQNEVVMVGVLLQHKYQIDKAAPKPHFDQHYCLITHPKEVPWPLHAKDRLSKIKNTNMIRCDSERDLLEELLKIIQKSDPDMILGYDTGFQFDLLMHRILKCSVSNWSRMGKLRRSQPPMFKGKVNVAAAFCGRPICDIQTSAKELNLKVRSYDLQSLCVAVLKKNEKECKEITPVECIKFYNTVEKIENLVRLTMLEASNIISIVFELNIIPLALQITCIAGNILSRTLSAGRAERNEYLLLHAFHERGYITPDKKQNKKGKDVTESRRKKPAYAGGLVLDPKKGFYEKLILLMDFNSLYPSIIQEYNLCFTTVPGAAFADFEDLNLPETDLEPGVVPTEIRKLVESRVQVKQMMKAQYLAPELKMQYNIRQMALKLTANSMYGCLGATHCRFYAKGLAALVTAKGREILQSTKRLVEKLNYEVIYGDTDSIMINTNIVDYDEVFSIGKRIKQEVNKLYRKVELDIDGVFKYLLLLQKKKYAAVTMSKAASGKIILNQEHKGLDIVRRDWCPLASETGKTILDQLLCDQLSEIRMENIFTYLQKVATMVKENSVPLSKLVITKQLSKDPNDYPDKKQAHVLVALRLNKEGGRMWKAGDTIPYIVCDDGTDKSATERAYHIEEYNKNINVFKIDADYYLLSQVFPVINRICEPIDGIDDALLAEHLGIAHLHKSKRPIYEQEETHIAPSIDEDKFKYCIPLKLKCQNESCKAEIEISDVVIDNGTSVEPSLMKCSNPDCKLQPWTNKDSIINTIQLEIRKIVTDYYRGWLECENPICNYRTRYIPLCPSGNNLKCTQCQNANMHRVYSESQLYKQLSFYVHIFNLNDRSLKKYNFNNVLSRECRAAYDTIKEHVEKQLRRNSFSVVNLDNISAKTVTKGGFQAKLEEEWSDFEDDEEDFVTNASQYFNQSQAAKNSQPISQVKSTHVTQVRPHQLPQMKALSQSMSQVKSQEVSQVKSQEVSQVKTQDLSQVKSQEMSQAASQSTSQVKSNEKSQPPSQTISQAQTQQELPNQDDMNVPAELLDELF